MVKERSVTGSIRAKLVRRFAVIAIGAALAACSIGYAATWAWSGSVVRDLTTRLPAGSNGENPQTGASAILSRQLDAFLHERIADVQGWVSAPTVIHAAQQAHVLHEESGLLDLTAEALENKLKVGATLGRFSIADGYLRAEIARSEVLRLDTLHRSQRTRRRGHEREVRLRPFRRSLVAARLERRSGDQRGYA